MKFPYLPQRYAISGSSPEDVRPHLRPQVDIGIAFPNGTPLFFRATFDTGSDSTLFPSSVANKLGIDLSGVANTTGHGIGIVGIQYKITSVELHLTDQEETFIWIARVGFFVDSRIDKVLLGLSGVLEYFDVEFLGDRRETILKPNSSFSGRNPKRESLPNRF